MPGAFAHMAAADQAKQAAESKGLDSIARSTLKYPQWLQAGTVGPDYSYLHHLRSHNSSDSWAELMHYNRTGDVVRSGIQWLDGKIGLMIVSDGAYMGAVIWDSGNNRKLIQDLQCTLKLDDPTYQREEFGNEFTLDWKICSVRAQ